MSKQYDAFVRALGGPIYIGEDSLPVARDKLESMHGHPIAADTRVEWTELGGVRCAWIETPESVPSRTLFLCHGGAFIAAAGDGYLFYAEMLARFCDARVLLVDYRLAPEHRYPAALDDCVAAYRGLIASGVSPASVAFIGDSCGGGLALASLLRVRERAEPMPACAITLGGWFDLEANGDSARHPVGPDPFACRAFTRARGRDYVGPDGDLRDPFVSPVHADFTGFPPLFLQVGQVDLTRDDALAVAAAAGRVGVDVRLDIAPGMIHGFQGLAMAGIPEAVDALERAARYLAVRIS